jgi:hypothetical protein
VDPMYEDMSVDEEDKPLVQRQAQVEPKFNNYFNFKRDKGAQAEEPPKKKKGDSLQDVVASLCKNPPGNGANSKLKMNLVTKVPPPIPAPKGKKPCHCVCNFSSYKYFLLTFFFYVWHYLNGPYPL